MSNDIVKQIKAIVDAQKGKPGIPTEEQVQLKSLTTQLKANLSKGSTGISKNGRWFRADQVRKRRQGGEK